MKVLRVSNIKASLTKETASVNHTTHVSIASWWALMDRNYLHHSLGTYTKKKSYCTRL